MDFDILRQKLNVLGYRQSLPISAIPLVLALFQDLIKTTESLRDSKLQIDKLLEEKSCWELGVQPYKCDNSKLLSECNRLNSELIKQKEEYEDKICDYRKIIRKLELDKKHLENHCFELENKLHQFSSSIADVGTKSSKPKNNGSKMNKKPFITTVPSGFIIPPDTQNHHHLPPAKCVKCHATINFSKLPQISRHDIEKLQNDVKEQQDLIALYKEKIDARDREIERLNNLLTGGRPPNALAKDCCYKNFNTLSEDIELLQNEKIDNMRKLNDYKESMHDAMEKTVDLIEKNRILQKELDEFKMIGLQMEKQANQDIANKTHEINELKNYIKKLEKDNLYLEKYKRNNYKCNCNINYSDNNQMISDTSSTAADYYQQQSHNKTSFKPYEDKRKLHEKLNELIVKEKELREENERLNQKYQKIKTKFTTLQKEHEEQIQIQKSDKAISTAIADEEKIRLKTERDFFQKEYLRLNEKYGNEKEIEFLQSQIKSKDNELQILRNELAQIKSQLNTVQSDGGGKRSSSTATAMTLTSTSDNTCAKSTILRIERERDIIKTELERIKSERNALNEKLISNTKNKMNEIQKYEEDIQQLKMKIMKLERINRELSTSQIPQQTQLILMKEENDEYKKHIFELQAENKRLSTSYSQLKILHEQTENSLIEYQNKLLVMESKLQKAECRLEKMNSDLNINRTEISRLKNEIATLKATNSQLENEKDKIITELDIKTEKLHKIELNLQNTQKNKQEMERKIQELQEKINKVSSAKRERECMINETSHEIKSLRQQLETLKASRDKVVHENGELSMELTNTKTDLCQMKCKLRDSEKEVKKLKQQLQQYVNEVKKVEELLSQKDRENEKMLEHYRSLSNDAVLLEGNNQSLEIEAAENRRQLEEAEQEIRNLRNEIAIKTETIEKLESQVESLSTQIYSLENDLDAVNELCRKLYLQRDKLNNELRELQNIRSKLEEENEKLRAELTLGNYNSSAGACALSPIHTTTTTTTRTRTQAATAEKTKEKIDVDSLKELLSANRHELEMQRSIAERATKEMKQLRQKVDELQKKLHEEHNKANLNEKLTNEFSIQIQELQNELTDERNNKSKAISPTGSSNDDISISNSPDSQQEPEENRLRGGDDGDEFKKISQFRQNLHLSSIPKNNNNKILVKKKSPKMNFNRGDANSQLFRKLTKNVDNEEKLVTDIRKFLVKGKVKKESKSNIQDTISFSEDSQDIVLRRHRTLINKTIIKNEAKLIDKSSTPVSTYRSDITPITNRRMINDSVKNSTKSLSLNSSPRKIKYLDDYHYNSHRRQESNQIKFSGIKMEAESKPKLTNSRIVTKSKESPPEKKIVLQNLKSKLQESKPKISDSKFRKELTSPKQNIKNENLEINKNSYLKRNRPSTYSGQGTTIKQEVLPPLKNSILNKTKKATVKPEKPSLNDNQTQTFNTQTFISQEVLTDSLITFEQSTQTNEENSKNGINSESYFQNFKPSILPTSTPIQKKMKNEYQLLQTIEKSSPRSFEKSKSNITPPDTIRSDIKGSNYSNLLQTNLNLTPTLDQTPTRLSSPNYMSNEFKFGLTNANNIKRQLSLPSPRRGLSKFKQDLIKDLEKDTNKNVRTSPRSVHREVKTKNLDENENIEKQQIIRSINNIKELLDISLTPKSIPDPSNYSPVKDIVQDKSGKSTPRSIQSSNKYVNHSDSIPSPRSIHSFKLTETPKSNLSPKFDQDQLSVEHSSGVSFSSDVENLEKFLEPSLLIDTNDSDLEILQFKDVIESNRSSTSTITYEQVNGITRTTVQNQSQRTDIFNNKTAPEFNEILVGKKSSDSIAINFKLPIVPVPRGPPPTFRGCPCMKAKRDHLRKMVGLPISADEDSNNEEETCYKRSPKDDIEQKDGPPISADESSSCEKIFYKRSIICRTSKGDIEQKECFECIERLQNTNSGNLKSDCCKNTSYSLPSPFRRPHVHSYLINRRNSSDEQ